VAKFGSERPFLERTVACRVVSYLYAVCTLARDATPFLFCRLGVDWDVVKKALHKDEAVRKKPAVEKDNGITERAAEAKATALPKETESKSSKKSKKERPVRCIQRHTDVEFRRAFRGVCEKLIEKAEDGGIQETRLLLQIGKFGYPKVAKRRGAKSLSAILLDELKRRQDEREAAACDKRAEEQMVATNETNGEGATSDSDAENR
jgi:hypothetical protein